MRYCCDETIVNHVVNPQYWYFIKKDTVDCDTASIKNEWQIFTQVMSRSTISFFYIKYNIVDPQHNSSHIKHAVNLQYLQRQCDTTVDKYEIFLCVTY